MTIYVRRELEFEHGIVETTGLDPSSTVRLCTGWRCDRSKHRTLQRVADFVLTERGHWDVQLEIPGRELAGKVCLETMLILLHAGPGSSPIAAQRTGSLLWYDEWSFSLSDDEDRFPMEWVDFRTSNHDDDVLWVLDWRPDNLEVAPTAAVRVLLNENARALDPLKSQGEPEAQRRLLAMLSFDIGRQLIMGALANSEFIEEADHFEAWTLGATLRRLVRSTFGSESYVTLRTLMLESPSYFESGLQAGLKLARSLTP